MQEIPIVLIGHKDHGKSTLVGRLILDSGSIKNSRLKDVKEVDEAWGREFELAHLVDSFKEEREREMTMDTTRVFMKGAARNYQLIDVPGHAELISNMLTGASNAEAALLMASIKEGIEEQTRQHLEIAKLLGIEQLGVVINKIDTVGYQQEAFERFKEKVDRILNEIGYASEQISFFPVSAKEGENVIRRSEKTPWYRGLTLMEFIENKIRTPENAEDSDFIFLSQDNYDNLTIGRIESGRIVPGQKVLVFPERKEVNLQSIQDSGGELKEAKAGQNIGVTFSDNLSIARGSVVASLNTPLKVGKTLAGEIFWITKPSQKRLVLECGTARTAAFLQGPENAEEGKKTPYEAVLEREIAFIPKSKTILGKIVLKDNGKIIAVGNIL